MTKSTALNPTARTGARRRSKKNATLSLVKPPTTTQPPAPAVDDDDYSDDDVDMRCADFCGRARGAIRRNESLPTLERKLLEEMRTFTADYTDQQIINFFHSELSQARAAYKAAVTRARVLAIQLGIDIEAAAQPSAHVKAFANSILHAPKPSTAEIERLLKDHLFSEHQFPVRSLDFMETFAREYPGQVL